MANRSLNCRDFRRLSLGLTDSALIAACQKALTGATPIATKGIMLKSGIQLNEGNADAWTFGKPLKGSLQNPEACQGVLIDNGGTRVQAIVEGQSFSAEVPVLPGANPVTGICQQAEDRK